MANQLTMAEIDRIKSLAAAGWSGRRIARELGCDRGTVRKYVSEARLANAARDGPDPDANDDSKPAKVIARISSSRTSVCEPFRATIEALLEKGLTAERIHRDLCEDHCFTHSYPSVVRFVRKLKETQPKRIWRMECEPGEEAQVDFGVTRTLRTDDGRLRYSNVLRVTLSFSRKAYTETVPYQNTDCFIRAIENAFRHFGGTPATLRIDNLKAGVKKADWHDPELNPKIEAFAAHYGTTIIPTRPYTPQHKGKVESDVAYVKSSALKGREFGSIAEQNTYLKEWEAKIADCRIHGTTRKQVLSHFTENEKGSLLPLPVDLFPAYQEGKRIVHRDSYVEVEKAYYQVPVEYIKRKVWVRWDSKTLQVFDRNMDQIASHIRKEPGNFSHSLGARGQRKGKPSATSHYWINRVSIYGVSVEKWAVAMASNRPDYAIRVLQGLYSLGNKHSVAKIDKACELALASGEYNLRSVKQKLELLNAHPDTVLKQDEFTFLSDHPVIRPLTEYQDLLESEGL
jgi:transposase